MRLAAQLCNLLHRCIEHTCLSDALAAMFRWVHAVPSLQCTAAMNHPSCRELKTLPHSLSDALLSCFVIGACSWGRQNDQMLQQLQQMGAGVGDDGLIAMYWDNYKQ
jgi:hypothetical protein